MIVDQSPNSTNRFCLYIFCLVGPGNHYCSKLSQSQGYVGSSKLGGFVGSSKLGGFVGSSKLG